MIGGVVGEEAGDESTPSKPSRPPGEGMFGAGAGGEGEGLEAGKSFTFEELAGGTKPEEKEKEKERESSPEQEVGKEVGGKGKGKKKNKKGKDVREDESWIKK